MRMTFARGVVLGALTSTLTMATTSALAGSGIGGVFNLGQKNTVDATSKLAGTTAGPMLNLQNTGTGSAASLSAASGPAAIFSTAAGVPPFTVKSNFKVTSLNADLLDGQDSTAFLPTGGTAADSNELGGVAAADYQLHSAIHLVAGTGVSVAAGADGTALANCADTEVAIAGGVRWSPVGAPATGLTIEMEGPSARIDGTYGSWRVDGHNGTGSSESLVPYVLCINA